MQQVVVPTKPNSVYGGFLKWGCTPNHPMSLEHFSIETHGDLGIPMTFLNPPWMWIEYAVYVYK